MTDSRTQMPKKRSLLAGCLSHLIFTALVIGLLIGGGYLFLQNYLQQYVGDIPTGSVTQVDTTQQQSIKVTVNRETTNAMLNRFIEQDLASDFAIKWQEDQLLATTSVYYNGLTLPVEISADLVVTEDDFFQIIIESVQLAEIPLPSKTAYELVASQLILPEWLIFHSDEPVIDVDLNRLPIERVDILLTAAHADLANDEITIDVHYDATNFDLFTTLNSEQ